MDNVNNTPEEIWTALNSSKSVLLALHTRPDLDSGGSCIALAEVLQNLGKSVKIISADDFTYLKNAFDVSVIEKIDPANIELSQFDTYIGLDSAIDRNTYVEGFKMPTSIKKINIDHHVINNYSGDINYVIPSEPATSTILYDLFKTWNVKINEKIAQALLGGILGDTGFFSYEDVTGKVLRTTADLLDSGANLFKTMWNLNMNEPLKLYKLKSKLYANLVVKGKYAYSTISLAEKAEFGMSPEEGHPTEADFFKGLEGMEFVFSIRELHNGKFKCSFRHRNPEFDTTILSVALGGGGHKAASAAIIENAKTLEESVQIVEEKIKELVSL